MTVSFLIAFLIILPICRSINVVIFLPGTYDGERQPLNRLAQELAFKNHAVCTFKAILIPETKYLVMQRLHLVRELKLNTGLPSEVYEPMKKVGNLGPWINGYDVKEYLLPFWKAYNDSCELILNSDVMDRLRDELYDVAVVYAGNPCHLGIVHALSIPFIYFDTTGFSDEIVMASGMPSLPGLVPSSMSTFSQQMSFTERAQNLWLQAQEYVPYTNVSSLLDKMSERWTRLDGPVTQMFSDNNELIKRFPYFPNVNEIKQKAAMYFVSSDPIIEFAGRPAWPNIVNVGGMHIEHPRPLLDPYNSSNTKANDGVIVMSFGNLVNGSAMPAFMREAFLYAFRKLPNVRVYWKINTIALPDTEDVPPNVNLTQFVPQNDLLADDRTKLLINHGGISSVMEAVHYGVPVLGIPLYGPGYNNLRKIESRGMAIILAKDQITKESMYNAIKELLFNKQYHYNAKQLSRIFNDRPMTPFETAIHWVEYIGRHHGAPYLDPVIAKNMPIYKYLLLDVIGIIGSIIYVVIAIVRLIFGKLCQSNATPAVMPKESRPKVNHQKKQDESSKSQDSDSQNKKKKRANKLD